MLHGNPQAIAQDFSPHMSALRRHVSPNVQFECCMILQGTLGGTGALGTPLEDPFKTNWREGLSCGPNPCFQHGS